MALISDGRHDIGELNGEAQEAVGCLGAIRVVHRSLKLPARQLCVALAGSHTGDAVKGERRAYSGISRAFLPHTVYDRYRLFPGAIITGPAIVEERESTVILGEDAKATVDEYGFLWIDLA